MRFAREDPWRDKKLPAVGDELLLEIERRIEGKFIGRMPDGVELTLPVSEVSWVTPSESAMQELEGSAQKVLIYERDDIRHVLKGSIKRLRDDPWPRCVRFFRVGSELAGVVKEVTNAGVRIELPFGVEGIVTADEMRKGGLEFRNFEDTVVEGQGLYVVVSQLLHHKKIVSLTLRRAGKGRRA